MHGREPPEVLYVMENGTTAVIRSARRVQRRGNMDPLAYNAGGVKTLRESKATPPVLGARTSAFIDSVTIFLLLALAFDM